MYSGREEAVWPHGFSAQVFGNVFFCVEGFSCENVIPERFKMLGWTNGHFASRSTFQHVDALYGQSTVRTAEFPGAQGLFDSISFHMFLGVG
jgi:hypothetical protein